MAMLNRILSLTFVSLLFVTAASAQGGSSSATGNKEAAVAEEKTTAFRPTKDQIMQGQKFLKDQKLYSGEATGVYNADTRAAIKQYQKANSLALTGNFNQATLEKMNIALSDKQKGITPAATSKTGTAAKTDTAGSTGGNAVSSEPKRPAPFRATADQITAAQKILRDGKMLTGGEDGKLDDATREGLGKYQDTNGLKVTRTLNAATLDKMGIALTAKQKEQVAAQAAYDAAKSASKDQ
jgi:peptidoglycan hydrolase-like protein with peptidoglycan-binding domain